MQLQKNTLFFFYTSSFRAKLKEEAPKDSQYQTVNDGELACTISHMSALSQFLTTDQEQVLIFEDDIKQAGKGSVPSQVAEVMKNVPSNWEFINFGRCWDRCENDVQVAPGVISPTRPMCSHAYSVSRSGAEKIMNECGAPIPLDHTFDSCFAHMVETKKLVTYAPNKALFYQDRATFASKLGSEEHYQECDYVVKDVQRRQVDGKGNGYNRYPKYPKYPGYPGRKGGNGGNGATATIWEEKLANNTLVAKIAGFFNMSPREQKDQINSFFKLEEAARKKAYDLAKNAFDACMASAQADACKSGLEGAMMTAEASMDALSSEKLKALEVIAEMDTSSAEKQVLSMMTMVLAMVSALAL